MSNYKSKHTGAQVDEAVSKVLNGEVGGGVTPDWNANEGETGYIENKPFGVKSKVYSLRNIDITNESIDYEDGSIDYWFGITYEFGICVFCDNIMCDEFVISAYQDNLVNKTYIDSYVEPLQDGRYKLMIHYRLEDIILDMWKVSFNEEAINYAKISELYIPDTIARKSDIATTVVKTTPQKLSDADKNQALTNLGIDPVVWKYICNPINLIPDSFCTNDAFEPVNPDDPDNFTARFKLPLPCFKNIFNVHGSYYIVTYMSSDKTKIYCIEMGNNTIVSFSVGTDGIVTFSNVD